MLHKTHISDIEIFTEEWEIFRLGKFTSSRIYSLMAEKPFSTGAISYIDQKVSEYVTKSPIADEEPGLDDENTSWGRRFEEVALKLFQQVKEIEYITTQKIIYVPDTNFSSTPDGIWVINSALTQENCLNAATIEVKCPRKYTRFMPLYRCNTPAEIKHHSSKYFWQVIDQMDNCDAAVGYFACYHPLFPEGKNMKIVEFNKLDLWDDFKLLKERKQLAFSRFNDLVSEFL